MIALPNEIVANIFAFATRPTLLTCRLLDHRFGELATAHAFRRIKLHASNKKPENFTKVSELGHLRGHVRVIDIDTNLDNFEYDANCSFKPPAAFFRALPSLRFFPNLKSLNLQFNAHCGNEDAFRGTSIEETYDFRYWVLCTVFNCLAGTWDPHKLQEMYKVLDIRWHDENGEAIDHAEYFPAWVQEEEARCGELGPICLETLAIGNLADYHDSRLTSSTAFKSVLASPSLTQLKLFVTCEEMEGAPEYEITMPERHEFFRMLPETWLAPEVARKLEVLSLFAATYWGWAPKMDFRDVNSGRGPDSGFPKLRVLALGNYIFSHEWQIDWIASLGRQNGHGGLLELYLDDCPILFYTKIHCPLDETPGHEGYAIERHVINSVDEGEKVERHYPLRWYQILPRWRKEMSALRVFKMGQGQWHRRGPPLTEEAHEKVHPELRHCRLNFFRRANFVDYDCPSPPASVRSYRIPRPGPDWTKFWHGVGILERKHVHRKDVGGDECRREANTWICPYVHFDGGIGPTQWCEDSEGLQTDEELEQLESKNMREAIESRARPSSTA
ncbi:hypothetical protein F4780DRAFT_477809 [Xylariomycetidae sp. FL0641]|nr:hypothetical protein F4780DRAFT_477809 [Xylariomycetidae sp. FL0641]